MAIVKFGVTVTGLSGTVGGGTFSRNKSGPYMKPWAKGANPRKTKQTTQRNLIAKYAVAWSTLTAGQRTDWDTYAADAAQEKTNSLGEPYYVSGFAWYVALSTNLENAGETAIDDAPSLSTPAAPGLTSFTFKATGASSNTRIGFNPSSPTIAMKKAVFLAVANSLGRAVQPAKPALMRIVAPSSNQITFQSQATTAFGTIPADMKGFVFAYNQNAEGRRGPVAALTDIADTP